MPLIDLWKKDRRQLEIKKVQQIIGFAGDGKLKDGKEASREFRDFLANIPSHMLQAYADECLQNSFDDSGLALQDIVNEIGRRLGFTVESGRYRGTKNANASGYDGLWRLPTGYAIVVEVKTTSAYQIHLKTIADYRRDLISDQSISEPNSSILIIVGRENTNDLEVQIRGSRYAWDMRLISINSLARMMMLKESVEDPQTIQRIYDILIPREFTKLDGIVEIVFSTAKEIKEDEEKIDEDEDEDGKPVPRFTPVAFHEDCVERVEKYLKRSLVKRTKASYSSPNESLALVCAVSKEHIKRVKFWFAFHPHQKTFLANAETSYVAFGCGSKDTVILIPFKDFSGWLNDFNTTTIGDRSYWHVQIIREGKGLAMLRKESGKRIDLTSYIL